MSTESISGNATPANTPYFVASSATRGNAGADTLQGLMDIVLSSSINEQSTRVQTISARVSVLNIKMANVNAAMQVANGCAKTDTCNASTTFTYTDPSTGEQSQLTLEQFCKQTQIPMPNYDLSGDWMQEKVDVEELNALRQTQGLSPLTPDQMFPNGFTGTKKEQRQEKKQENLEKKAGEKGHKHAKKKLKKEQDEHQAMENQMAAANVPRQAYWAPKDWSIVGDNLQSHNSALSNTAQVLNLDLQTGMNQVSNTVQMLSEVNKSFASDNAAIIRNV